MTIIQVFVLAGISLIAAWRAPHRWRPVILAGASLLALYGLQPSTSIRHLDFWLPTASIFLTSLVWVVTRHSSVSWRQTLPTLAGLSLLVVGVGLTRYTGKLCCITPTRPPPLLSILAALALVAVIAWLLSRVPYRNLLVGAVLLIVLGVFIVLKQENLGRAASAILRQAAGQNPSLSSALDLRWLGFSYLAFRLLHILRDAQSGKYSPASLSEFVTYSLFFPTLTAGPLDRIERFRGDLRSAVQPRYANISEGSYRILLGLFKKFVLADSLSLVALNASNTPQVSAGMWTWLLLYAYNLRIYWDFSGYTDVALGLGRILGFRLPENFNAPYLKSNLTAFWNSWHITLAQWFRAYFFNPTTRALRTKQAALPAWAIIFAGQISTMLLIGLWHGLTWNFAIWGLWHGIGLYVHNRWSAWVRPRLGNSQERGLAQRGITLVGWLLTFNYVSLGWVWFALPNPGLSWLALGKLLGFSA